MPLPVLWAWLDCWDDFNHFKLSESWFAFEQLQRKSWAKKKWFLKTIFSQRHDIYNVTCSLVNGEGFAISVWFYMIMRLGCEKHVLGSLDYFRKSPLRTEKWRKSSIVSNRYFWLLLILLKSSLSNFGVLEDQADPLVQWQRSVLACSRAQMQILKTFSRIFAKISFKCRAEPWPGHLSVRIRESIIGRLWARYKFHLNFREIYIKALYQVGAGAANAIIFRRVLESVFSEMQIVHRRVLRLPKYFVKSPRQRICRLIIDC